MKISLPLSAAKFDGGGNLISAAPCGSGLGDTGGTPALTKVAFSATPTFPITNTTQRFRLTLTGTVTSSTFSGVPNDGQEVWFRICQDASGGHPFVYPASVPGRDAIDTAAKVNAYLYPGASAALNLAIYSNTVSGSGIDTPGSPLTNGILGRIPAALMNSSHSDRTATPGTGLSVVSGTKYWLVVYQDNTDGTGDIALNFSTVSGYIADFYDGSTWRGSSTLFKTFINSSATAAGIKHRITQ